MSATHEEPARKNKQDHFKVLDRPFDPVVWYEYAEIDAYWDQANEDKACCADCGDPTPLDELRCAYDQHEGYDQRLICLICFDLGLEVLNSHITGDGQ